MTVEGKPIRFWASDGRLLEGTWFGGHAASDRSLVMAPAMATPARFYHRFAAHLAGLGWGVLCFDYRGVASNRRPGDERDVSLDDWRDLDLPGAVAEIRRRAAPRFLGAVCHSVGGQLIGQSPVRTQLDGALLVACQRGIPRLFRGRWRLRLELVWRLLPAWLTLFDTLPTSKATLQERVPPGALLQWARWSRTGRFTDWDGRDTESRFREALFPVTSVALEGDEPYAPQAAVDALSDLYPRVERVTLRGRDFGGRPVGHFQAFRPGRPDVWAGLVRLLSGVEARAKETKIEAAATAAY